MSWIESKLSLIEKKNADKIIVAPPKETISQKELDAIKEKFTTRVQYYCNIMGVSVNRISIKDQKTRWGSCSSKGNVNFNYKLYYMPQALMDYVIVHELSHRKYMNHSDLFWNEVQKYCIKDYLQKDYYDAVFEAAKGLAQRVRDITGLTTGGGTLF